MFTLKATVLLGAPLLAAASEVIPSRIQRRAALLELLEHQHERRQTESYGGAPNTCSPDAGTNQASFVSLPAGGSFADAVYTYVPPPVNGCQVTETKCQDACIQDSGTCYGYTYLASCTLYGDSSFGGVSTSVIPAGFMLLQNGGSLQDNAPTCATTGDLDTVDSSTGRCTCAAGRHLGSSAFVCEADAVPATAYKAPPQTLQKPVTFTSPISWAPKVQGVPAVLNADQCAAVCLADSSCQAYIYRFNSQLASCWKIGAGGVYSSPNDGINGDGTARLAKRATTVGVAGDSFGQSAGSSLVNDAAAPTPSGGARLRMRVKRGHSSSQW